MRKILLGGKLFFLCVLSAALSERASDAHAELRLIELHTARGLKIVVCSVIMQHSLFSII